jgi:hypothetical protein
LPVVAIAGKFVALTTLLSITHSIVYEM